MPDFINDYGMKSQQAWWEQNPQLHADLDYPLGNSEDFKDPKALEDRRAVILTSEEATAAENPYPSLSRQALLYDTLTSEYKEFLAQKLPWGEWAEAQKNSIWQVSQSHGLVSHPGDPWIDSPFCQAEYRGPAKTGAKPNTIQVVNAVRKRAGVWCDHI